MVYGMDNTSEQALVSANRATLNRILGDLKDGIFITDRAIVSEINIASLNPCFVVWNPRDGVERLDIEYRVDPDLLASPPHDHFELRVGKRRLYLAIDTSVISEQRALRALLVPEEPYVAGVIEKICAVLSHPIEVLVERAFALVTR